MSAPYNLPDRDLAVPSHWLQLEIVAKKGRHTAHGVALQLLSVHRTTAKESKRVNIEIAQFCWSNSFSPIAPITLAPGLSRKVDIAALVATDSHLQEPDGVHRYPLWLQAQPRPSEDRDHLVGGTYLVKVALVADDIDAAKYQFEIHYDGLWWDTPQMIWQHLSIENLKKIK